MKIYLPFTLYFSDKNLYDKPPGLLFLVVFISFYISRYNFNKFLEFHSPSGKKIFVTNFPFLTDSLKPPPLPHPPPLP